MIMRFVEVQGTVYSKNIFLGIHLFWLTIMRLKCLLVEWMKSLILITCNIPQLNQKHLHIVCNCDHVVVWYYVDDSGLLPHMDRFTGHEQGFYTLCGNADEKYPVVLGS